MQRLSTIGLLHGDLYKKNMTQTMLPVRNCGLENSRCCIDGILRFSSFAVGIAEVQRKAIERDWKVVQINYMILHCHFDVWLQVCLSSPQRAHIVTKLGVARALQQHVEVYSPGITTNKIELGYSHQDHNILEID